MTTDEEVRDLARRAGERDLDAARRLVEVLERDESPDAASEVGVTEHELRSALSRAASGRPVGAAEAGRLVAQIREYRTRLKRVSEDRDQIRGKLQSERDDALLVLRWARSEVDPHRRGLHYSQMDLARCAMMPALVAEARERVLAEFERSLPWRAPLEAQMATPLCLAEVVAERRVGICGNRSERGTDPPRCKAHGT